MANYKPVNYAQTAMIPVDFSEQILPGTFEHTLHYLIEDELSLRAFDADYHNDDGGAPAYDPRVLLKIVLFAYSKGILSSRRIAYACQTHIIFMALSANTCPHFSTIAAFVSSHTDAIAKLFRDVLWVCDQAGLIGREMFAIDGCKLPSNAGKEWSGTRADFEKKVSKLQTAIERMLAKHQQLDQSDQETDWLKREQQQIATLQAQIKKLTTWLEENPHDRRGPSGRVIKSNITDPESAKMTKPSGTVLNVRRTARRANPRDGVSKCHRGVIQGYNGIAAVDSKHQIIITAQAHGVGQESHLVKPMVEAIRNTFRGLLKKGDIFNDQGARLLADAGYHNGDNMIWLEQEKIDAYIADGNFRKRDPRFADACRHKSKKPQSIRFQQKDFSVDLEQLSCRCPAGHEMYLKNRNFQMDGRKAIAFMARQSDCGPCPHRSRCLKKAEQKSPRQIHWFLDTET